MATTLATLISGITNPDVKALYENLMKESPIIGHAPIIKANRATSHLYRHWSKKPAITGRALEEGFAVSKPEQEEHQIDLKEIGVVHSEDATVVGSSNLIQRTDFFQERAPLYFEAIAQAMAAGIYTGTAAGKNFHSLNEAATANSAVVDATGGSSGSRTSIYLVDWNPNSTGIVINPAVVSDITTLVHTEFINDLKIVMQVLADSTEQPVYKVMYRSMFNFLNNSNRRVARMENVEDTAQKLPTAKRLSEMIRLAKAKPGSSYFYTSPLGANLIDTLKDDKLQMLTTNMEYSTSIKAYNGIPIFVDENITETQ